MYAIEWNPVRNSTGASNPAGIILGPNSAARQLGIISNGVKMKEVLADEAFPRDSPSPQEYWNKNWGRASLEVSLTILYE